MAKGNYFKLLDIFMESYGIPRMPYAAKKNRRSVARVAVATFKGGDGKSTVAISLASLASTDGHKTLLIDLEQRGHAAFALLQELPTDERRHGAKHLLLEEDFTPLQAKENFDVLPGSTELDDARVRRLDNETLHDLVAPLPYDRIYIDCPANDQILLRMGVVAADTLLVPIMANPWGRNAAEDMLTWAKERMSKGRIGPSRIAIVANRLDLRRSADSQLVAHLEETFPDVSVFPLRGDIGLLNMVLERRPLRPSDLSEETLNQLREIGKWIDSDKKS